MYLMQSGVFVSFHRVFCWILRRPRLFLR